MLCFLALMVFATLAVFSARYRPLAKEAIDCVCRRITLRKCTTGFDTHVKAALTGRLMRNHPRAARWLHRHVELLAWVFVALTVLTVGFLGYGFSNYYRYGNCYGPVGKGFCIFDPSGARSRYSGILTRYRGPTIVPDEGGAPTIGPQNATVTVVEFGSYTCPYTRQSEPVVARLLQRYAGRLRFVYRQFPLDGLQDDTAANQAACGAAAPESHSQWPAATVLELSGEHAGATRAARAAMCARAQGQFWEYHHLLCARPDAAVSCHGLRRLTKELNMDEQTFATCLADPAVRAGVERDFEAGVHAGLYGTPTFFVNGVELVAPSAAHLEKTITQALESSRR